MSLITIDAKQLRAALADIEAAEKNGFHHCLAVLEFGDRLPSSFQEISLRYSDLIERAGESASLNWGRFQGVTRRFRFDAQTGTLVPLWEDCAARVKGASTEGKTP